MNRQEAIDIGELISEISSEVALPKYKNLKPKDVSEKGRGDCVTLVDMEIQSRLVENLISFSKGSIFVSEELSLRTDASQLVSESQHRDVWFIDPLDGTKNFIDGSPNFCTAVALFRRGLVTASWIHMPIKSKTVCALENEGAWLLEDDKQLRVSGEDLGTPPVLEVNTEIEHLYGDYYIFKKLRSRSATYIALVTGELDGAVFVRNLKWWDHLPGTFIHTQAGGTNATFDGEKYSIVTNSDLIISAKTKQMWSTLKGRAGFYVLAPSRPILSNDSGDVSEPKP